MSDKKISQLTAATTPLAGTETLPIVQGGQTVKVTAQSVANLAPAELPSQTGNNGKYLTTNGSTASWGTVSAGPTVFSFTVGLTSGGLNSPTQIVNQLTGSAIIFDQAVGQINLVAILGTPFTANKTFVSCSSISTSSDVGVFGGATISPTQLDLRFYSTSGGAYSFTGKTTLVNLFVKVEIYP
jgi:hypothetical protein